MVVAPAAVVVRSERGPSSTRMGCMAPAVGRSVIVLMQPPTSSAASRIVLAGVCVWGGGGEGREGLCVCELSPSSNRTTLGSQCGAVQEGIHCSNMYGGVQEGLHCSNMHCRPEQMRPVLHIGLRRAFRHPPCRREAGHTAAQHHNLRASRGAPLRREV